MWIRKRTLIGLLLGAVAVGSVVSVGAQEGGGDRPPDRDRPHPAAKQDGKRGKGELVREQKVVKAPDGIRTIAHDLGVVQSVSGRTLTIREADGSTPSFEVPEDAKVARDGARAQLSDLMEGDHAKVMRVDEGSGLLVRGVFASSPEHRAQMEAQREACRQDPEACRRAKQAGQRDQRREKMRQACEQNPERCAEAKRRAEERRREFCQQNPDRCAERRQRSAAA